MRAPDDVDVCPARIQVDHQDPQIRFSPLFCRNPDPDEILEMTNLLPILRDEIIAAYEVSLNLVYCLITNISSS